MYNSGVQTAVLLFARAPLAGAVKTRLTPAVGPSGAVQLHLAMADDLLRRLSTVWPVELWTDVPTKEWSWFPGPRRLQAGDDLGARMLNAVDSALDAGVSRVVLLGTDCPWLPLRAIRRLLDGPWDVALGPARDGGFWGIAANRTAKHMFRGVTWSQPDVLVNTLRACRAAGLSAGLGPLLEDVDDPRSLARLSAYLPEAGCARTRQQLRRRSMCLKVIHF